MKRKRNLIFLLILGFIVSFGYVSVCNGIPRMAADDIEWGVNVGDKFTWVVSKTNESMGFLPKNSKFELTITEFENLTISPGEPIDLVRANFSVYNSETKQTIFLLSNHTFVTFIWLLNDTIFYAPFYDHGLFLPSNYYEGFIRGYMSVLANYFDFNAFSFGFVDETYRLIAYNISNDIHCKWEFNENFVTDTLTIYQDTPTNIQYLLVLDGIDGDGGFTIPFGNNYLIFFGITLLATTYLIYIKKISGKNKNLRS